MECFFNVKKPVIALTAQYCKVVSKLANCPTEKATRRYPTMIAR